MGTNLTRGGTRDAAKELEQRTLTGTVLTNDTYYITLLDIEIDIAQRPDILGRASGGTVIGFTDFEVRVLLAKDIGNPEAADIVAKGLGRDQA